MLIPGSLPAIRSTIEEKATQKYPFTLNNETYFTSECFYEQAIINGVSLEVKEARGIPNEEDCVGYLSYSNRLVYYAGANIICYNTYKRTYEVISNSCNLVCLKAQSFSTAEKEYIAWLEKSSKSEGEDSKVYTLCLYDLTVKQKIYEEKFQGLPQQIKAQNLQLLVYMHPCIMVGIVIFQPEHTQTTISYKMMARSEQRHNFGAQCTVGFPFKFKFMRYDLESNSFFFMRNDYELGVLRCSLAGSSSSDYIETKPDQPCLQVQAIISSYRNKRLGTRRIVHFGLSEAYLLLLTCSQDNTERYFEFYSIFNYDLVFSALISGPDETALANPSLLKKNYEACESTEEEAQNPVIDRIEFNKSVIIGMRGSTTIVSIFSLHEQNLRHIRNTVLNLDNCYRIAKLFINPFSSEVIVLSRSYELEGTVTTAQRSTKLIKQSVARYKSFYLELSSFFITMEASLINVGRMGLEKKNHLNVLTAPWLSEYFVLSEYSIKSKRWEEKFDAAIRCSAIHPTGQYIAIGFNDCFKVYFLTHEKLIHNFVSENVKECTSLAYSKMGNQFAAATYFNIFIYDCYSYLKKHQICLGLSYRIEEISYVEGFENGRTKHCLQCITTNKRLVVYNAEQQYREEFAFNPKSHVENSMIEGIMSIFGAKTAKMSSNRAEFSDLLSPAANAQTEASNSKKFGVVFYDERTKVVIFTHSQKIYFINTQNFQPLGTFDFDQVSCVEYCRHLGTLFFGTQTGKIIAFPWPNKPINITSKTPTFSVHKSRVKKIKVSSNLNDLITVADESLYIHSITLVKEMRKIQKVELQRECFPQSLVAIDFYMKVGLCLFTTEKLEQKCQAIKENEEEAMNFNFILPEEREKQKLGMLRKLEGERERIAAETMDVGMPMKLEAVNLKQKLKNLQKQLKQNTVMYQGLIDKQVFAYQKKLSELTKQQDDITRNKSQIVLAMQKQISHTKQKYRLEEESLLNQLQQKLSQADRMAAEADRSTKTAANNFLELAEMDQQIVVFNEKISNSIDGEISALQERNGYLMCRNTNIEKDIRTKRRKIQDIKDLITSIQRNIESLPRRDRKELSGDDIRRQEGINQQFGLTEKRYLAETKKLIDKNKAVNISIQLYEKQRNMLALLEKKLESEEKKIDDILDYIMMQRQNKATLKQRVGVVSEKASKYLKKSEATNQKRTKLTNELKQYIFKLSQFQHGVISLQRLKKISQIRPQDMRGPPENLQIKIDEKKKKIQKILSSEDKILNVMKNERKIYSNQKKKATHQNQDLLVNFNFLLHENKHLTNVMKAQQSRRKYCIKSVNRKENARLLTKPTPFQSYLSVKTTRRMKTSPAAEYQL